MKPWIAWRAASTALLLAFQASTAASQQSSAAPAHGSEGPTTEALFTPEDDATAKIVALLGRAKHEIAVQAYLFTSRKLANALLRAHRAGVWVEVIVDQEQLEKGGAPGAAELAAAGVPVYADSRHAAAHSKILLIDAATEAPVLITGSYNFTVAAQSRNAENVLIIRGDQSLAAAYRKNWQHHRAHSVRLQ